MILKKYYARRKVIKYVLRECIVKNILLFTPKQKNN